MEALYNPEEDEDLIDGVVDTWTSRLEKGKSVWFEHLWRLDIDCRKEKPKIADKPQKSQKAGEVHEDGETQKTTITLLAELTTRVEEMNKSLVASVDKISRRVDDINERLVAVEELTLALSNANPIRAPAGEEELEEMEDEEGEEEKEDEEREGEKEEEEEEEEEEGENEEKEEEKQSEEEDVEDVSTDSADSEDLQHPRHNVRKNKRKKTYSNLRRKPFEVRETRHSKRARKDGEA